MFMSEIIAAPVVTNEPRLFSVESAKAVKATEFGYLNGIHYMAPHRTGGAGNLCPKASAGCMALCLGMYSGQASMVADLEHGINNVRASRQNKARMFVSDRAAYLNMMARQGAQVIAKARAAGLIPCLRLNGSTDIPFERMLFALDARTKRALARIGYEAPARAASILALFPDVQFVDYTKIANRLDGAPSNLSLTFSRSETNEAECLDVLRAGGNVAIVFGDGLPATWNGFQVIDGDKHDLRHLDARNVVVGLKPKGNKAKRDTSGFVLRQGAALVHAA